jgi:hypothetical protein
MKPAIIGFAVMKMITTRNVPTSDTKKGVSRHKPRTLLRKPTFINRASKAAINDETLFRGVMSLMTRAKSSIQIIITSFM